MRQRVDAERIRRFMEAFGRESRRETTVYFAGGASAVIEGWRATTADVDLKIIPDDDAFRILPRLKEALQLNVELATPSDFIPELPKWKERSPHIARIKRTDFHHVDFYSQALAKIERGLDQDLADVREMVRRGLVDPAEALRLYAAIEPLLGRYPAIDPGTFRRAVDTAFGAGKRRG
jgi:hypothetical protein